MITAYFATPAGLTAQNFKGTMEYVDKVIQSGDSWIRVKTQRGAEVRVQLDKVAFWVGE